PVGNPRPEPTIEDDPIYCVHEGVSMARYNAKSAARNDAIWIKRGHHRQTAHPCFEKNIGETFARTAADQGDSSLVIVGHLLVGHIASELDIRDSSGTLRELLNVVVARAVANHDEIDVWATQCNFEKQFEALFR